MTWKGLVTVGALAVGLSACGSSSPTAPSALPALTAGVLDAVELAIQDEYRAETIYQGVVDDLGPVLPFLNVLSAEQRHSDALAGVFLRRGLPVPATDWNSGNVEHFGSVPEACRAGVVAEQHNIALYDGLLLLDLPEDVRQVFSNNRSASLLGHLPAFERCS